MLERPNNKYFWKAAPLYPTFKRKLITSTIHSTTPLKQVALRYFLLFTYLTASYSNAAIRSAWHYKRGDISSDLINDIRTHKQIYLQYNEVTNLEFVPQQTKETYFYKIPSAEKLSRWIEIGTEPIVQIPMLNGGQYTLYLATQADDAHIIDKVNIAIKQAFWQEWWFFPSIFLYFMGLVGIGIYFFSLYNIRQKLKLYDVRNKIAADLHDEVGSNLNSISIFIELLRRKSPPELYPILDKITKNSSESLQLMQDTIWAIQTKNDNFNLFIDKMRGLATSVLGAKGIAFEFASNLPHTNYNISMDVRKNAYLIYKEAINNITKHSQAKKAFVTIDEHQSFITIIIGDDGIGFDTGIERDGNGLKNFEERATTNGLVLMIYSEINVGTTITLKIPF